METGDPAGVRFEGDQGWVFVQRGAIKAADPEILRWKPGQGEVKLIQSANHMKNFLEAVRSRKDPAAPVEVGHRSNTICMITHIAMKLGRKLAWDPAAERFVGDDEANSRPPRLPARGAMARLSARRPAVLFLLSIITAAFYGCAAKPEVTLLRDDGSGTLA